MSHPVLRSDVTQGSEASCSSTANNGILAPNRERQQREQSRETTVQVWAQVLGGCGQNRQAVEKVLTSLIVAGQDSVPLRSVDCTKEDRTGQVLCCSTLRRRTHGTSTSSKEHPTYSSIISALSATSRLRIARPAVPMQSRLHDILALPPEDLQVQGPQLLTPWSQRLSLDYTR